MSSEYYERISESKILAPPTLAILCSYYMNTFNALVVGVGIVLRSTLSHANQDEHY